MTDFTIHTIDTAPERARAGLSAAQQKLGFIPNMMAVLAESPVALEGYQAVQGALATSSLSTAEQHFLALAISVDNGCTYCVPAYSMMAAKSGTPQQAVDAVRDGQPIHDGRLSALRDFTRAVVEKRGRVAEEEGKAFFAAGFTKAQVLEVILAVAFKLISNYTNQVADIPLDEVFQAYRWDGQKAA